MSKTKDAVLRNLRTPMVQVLEVQKQSLSGIGVATPSTHHAAFTVWRLSLVRKSTAIHPSVVFLMLSTNDLLKLDLLCSCAARGASEFHGRPVVAQ